MGCTLANVTIAGRPNAWQASSAISASPTWSNVSAITKSTPSSTAQPSCSSYCARTTIPETTGSFGSYDHVLQMFPATSAPPSRATSLAIRTAARFSCLQLARAPDVSELLAVGVVGERHHDVRTRAQELAVQLAQCVGGVEDHLGHVGPGLDVAAALELEDVALGADDDALGETLLQRPLRRTAHRSAPAHRNGRGRSGRCRRPCRPAPRTGEHPPDPRRELVTGASPADADEGAGEARDGAEHELVVGHEVVVAPVDVLDVADRRVAQPGHALLDEVRDAVDAARSPGRSGGL